MSEPSNEELELRGDLALAALQAAGALFILLWIVFIAYAAMLSASLSATIPLANAATGLLLLSLCGVWKVIERYRGMRYAFVFALGLLLSVAVAFKVSITLVIEDVRPMWARIVVAPVWIGAILGNVALGRWSFRRSFNRKSSDELHSHSARR